MFSHRLFTLQIKDLFTANKGMDRCLKLAALAAASDVPALVLGETGTGKTLLAQAIHNSSKRARGAFISFNASAMSDTLLESQLFGHERGAFTGAQKAVKGKFELADAGTLFFDEVADMSPLAQAKILRAIEYGQFERLGSERPLHSNARIISATNLNLRQAIRNGKFREDLYHRLAGLTLHIPPLRDRPEDLPGLIAVELDSAARAAGKNVTSIHSSAMRMLLDYAWPGNLRELHHTLRSIVLLTDGHEVLPEHVAFDPESYSNDDTTAARVTSADIPAPAQDRDLSLSHAIRKHIVYVLSQCDGSQRQAARMLGISRSRLARHLKGGNGAAT